MRVVEIIFREMNERWNAATYYTPSTGKLEQLPLPVIFNHHYLNNVYVATRTMMTIFLLPLYSDVRIGVERDVCLILYV